MTSRVHVACLGTFGDVLPAVELAGHLRARGCAVTVGAEPAYAASIRARGLDWRPIGGNTAEDWAAGIRDVLAHDLDPHARGAAIIRRLVSPQRAAIERLVLEQAAEHDVTVVNGLLGFALPRLLRAQCVVAYWVSGPILESSNEDVLRDAPFPILLSTSRHLFPEHAAIGGEVTATGFWTTAGGTPCDSARINTEPHHVLISLSSASLGGIGGFVALAEQVTQELGCRVSMVDPTCDVATQLSERVRVVPLAPHPLLLQGIDCHVHQGGSGTVGETLRAGVRSVVLPQWADQPRFGRRLVSLGLASDSILPKDVTPARVVAAVRAALADDALGARARAMAECLRREPGLRLAADIVSRHAALNTAGEN